ncbi:MAG: hypothetical protein WBC44_16200 [Planctomycetaceae bacterium]
MPPTMSDKTLYYTADRRGLPQKRSLTVAALTASSQRSPKRGGPD